MRIINISENESIKIDDDLIKIVENIKSNNLNLPLYIVDDLLYFKSYTVGSVQILDTVININPRNPVFSLSTIFEMMLYLDNISINRNTSGYNFTDSSGVTLIPRYFFDLCKNLTNYGLSGGYLKIEKKSKSIDGDIIFEKFSMRNAANEGLYINNQFFSINILPNQIIKSALIKSLKLITDKSLIQDISILLREFEFINEYNGQYINIDTLRSDYYCSNPYYHEVLEIALVILLDIKLTMLNGEIEWFSFLQNSNDLFEKYIRKLLADELGISVCKWENPREYAVVKYNDFNGIKRYSPDIIIGYDEKKDLAKIILDVKNKVFEPNQLNISEFPESSDLYQLLFYLGKLDSKLGGLVYPSDKYYDPITVNVDFLNDIRIILFSINMKDTFKNRKKVFINSIFENLLKFI